MKHYLIFINNLDGLKVVAISTFDDEESLQKAYKKHEQKLSQNGFDWLGYPQVEYHQIQTLAEVN